MYYTDKVLLNKGVANICMRCQYAVNANSPHRFMQFMCTDSIVMLPLKLGLDQPIFILCVCLKLGKSARILKDTVIFSHLF